MRCKIDRRHKHSEWTPETLTVLQTNIAYDPETGNFRWLVNKAGKKAGEQAGCVDPVTNYRSVCVNRTRYYEHYLAILFSGQTVPNGMWIDHINGNKSDNRLFNLRVVTPSQNGHHRTKLNKNNKSGAAGVRFDPSRGKFFAYINVNRKMIALGRFKTHEEAAEAREAARQKIGAT